MRIKLFVFFYCFYEGLRGRISRKKEVMVVGVERTVRGVGEG